MKKNKIITSLVAIGAISIPTIAAVSCNSKSDKLIVLSGKTQITDHGKKFIEYFKKTKLFQDVKNGADDAQFITKNGDKYLVELATTYGTNTFPSVFMAANPQTVKPYIDKKAITIFKDPKYNQDGIATNEKAEQENIKIAGEKVNAIIKQLETTNRSSLLLRNKQGDILGFPTYSEAMGIIYNKNLFKKAGVKIAIDKSGAAMTPTEWATKIYGTSAVINSKIDVVVNPIKDLTSAAKTNQLLAHIIAVLKSEYPNLKSKGIVTSGKESWAFTSKVLGITGISAAAIKSGLLNQGAVIPGEIYSENRLTPSSAQKKLFTNKTQWGIKGLAELAKFFLGSSSNNNGADKKMYSTNNDMLDGFVANQILTIPQGTWVEQNLNKTSSLSYGFLPIPVDGAYDKIAVDTTAHWYIADQKNSHDRSNEKAKAMRTQAINFIYSHYLTDEGQKSLESDMGLNNPYKANKYLDASKHPLIVDANKYEHINWGVAFIKPGVGKTGYERNNNAWTSLLTKYARGSATLEEIKNKAINIWKST